VDRQLQQRRHVHHSDRRHLAGSLCAMRSAKGANARRLVWHPGPRATAARPRLAGNGILQHRLAIQRRGRRRVGATFRGWEGRVRRDGCPAEGRPSRASYSACEPIQNHTMSPSSASTASAR
jgi:hypothetical protein